MDARALLSWARRGCFAAAGLLIVVGIALAVWHRPQLARKAAAVALAGARIAHPEVVEQRAGRTVWRLRAEAAEEEDGVMALRHPRLEIAMEGGGMLVAEAPRGRFQPNTRSAKLMGGVRAHWQAWRLSAPVLVYAPAQDALIAPQGFVLVRKGWGRARGRMLRIQRGVRRLVAEGHVRVEVQR